MYRPVAGLWFASFWSFWFCLGLQPAKIDFPYLVAEIFLLHNCAVFHANKV
jgi:hypothetical protein